MIRCCTEALKYMSKANGGKGGVIVNTESVGGLGPVKWAPVYSATKSANVGYAISWGVSFFPLLFSHQVKCDITEFS